MRIAVCDDEKLFRDEIIQSLEDFFGKLDLCCSTYEDGEKLVSAYQNGEEPDAVFLDIEMASMNGMVTAIRLRELGFLGPIIFLTSHTEFAMEGYEVNAFRFLPKPIQREKMEKTLADLKALLFEQKKIAIRCEGEDVILVVDEICYVEAMNNSVSIVLKDKEYTIRRKITDMEKELNALSPTFVRIHRGYLVNLAHVTRHKLNEVYVSGGSVLPLSRSMAKPFKEQLLAYVRDSAR